MKHKLTLSALALLMSSAALAEPIEHQVTVTATVPTEAFYVTPAGGNWMNDPQDLGYNSATGQLNSVTRQLDMRSTSGAISAHLLGSPNIISGSDRIDLTINVNGVALSTTSGVVLAATEAAAGDRVNFQIVPETAPTGGFEPGSYTGIISMVFETPDP
ncbi:CS1 type fimbrial major subunit [Rheinheimera sp. NSM]|uniref:CS1 type fimbrial major subunit n=1 Tax=Rheinheimera sp. NSM TaxID=3457884 RepID=UPI00403537C5